MSPVTTGLHTRLGQALPLLGVQAHGQVQGRLLDMRLQQRFHNPGPANVEIVYTFPLPWGAVLLGVEVQLNGQTLRGQVTARQAAREQYEASLSEGHSAILLVQNPDHSHTLELGNLLAGEHCVIELHYAQLLQPEQGSLRLMLPTTLAPRHGDPVRQGGLPAHAVVAADPTVQYPFEITLTLLGALAQGRLQSPSHPIALRPQQGGVQVQLGRQAWLDRDFVLLIDELPSPDLGLRAPDLLSPGTEAVLCSFVPRLPQGAGVQSSVLKVLVDCSGSMNGDSIEAARQALGAVVQALGPEDRFTLSRFGDTVEHRSKGLWRGAGPAKAAARRWAQDLQADLGGTEMAQALTSTFALGGNTQAAVLLVTDGEIEGIEAVVRVAKASGQRVFVVGLGSSPAEPHLRRLAAATHGACEFVAPGEAAGPAIQRMFHRLRSPRIDQLRIEWPVGVESLNATEVPGVAFDGDTLSVYGRLRIAPEAPTPLGPVRLLGQGAGQSQPGVLAELCLEPLPDPANTLARMAAHQRYRELKQIGEVDEVPAYLRADLPALAERYQLVTPDTSLVLVQPREAGQAPADMPELVQIRPMQAAGWAGQGSVLFDQALAHRPDPAMARLSSAPSVWRTVRQPASARAAVPDPIDFNMPAFLRKSDPQDLDSPLDPMEQAVSASHRYRHSQDGVEAGSLTPLGLQHWLQQHSPTQWPSRYADLRKLGLPARVLEWLELVIGEGQDEAEVVATFNQCLQASRFSLGQVFKALVPGGVDAQSTLRLTLQQALAPLQPQQWPEAVLEFAEQSADL